MKLILTAYSERKLANVLRRGGQRPVYFRDNHGQLHSASIHAETSPSTVNLTLRHGSALHSIDLNRQQPDIELRAARWIEDCANGVEEAA